MSLYAKIDTWIFPSALLSESLEIMRKDGAGGCEGIAFWLGTEQDGIATIQTVVSIEGYGIQKHPLYMEVTPDAMNALSDAAEARGQYLIGQVHSHPGTYTDLSPTDVRYGISSPYYLSAVAPHYATDPSTQWQDCGIHVFLPGRGFTRFNASAAEHAIQVVRGRSLERVDLRGAQ